MGKNQTAGSAGTGLELKYKVYRENGEIRVEHANGYYGVLYNKSSLAIFHGTRWVLHTAHRTINTAEELAEMLEDYPAFERWLTDCAKNRTAPPKPVLTKVKEGEKQCEDL